MLSQNHITDYERHIIYYLDLKSLIMLKETCKKHNCEYVNIRIERMITYNTHMNMREMFGLRYVSILTALCSTYGRIYNFHDLIFRNPMDKMIIYGKRNHSKRSVSSLGFILIHKGYRINNVTDETIDVIKIGDGTLYIKMSNNNSRYYLDYANQNFKILKAF